MSDNNIIAQNIRIQYNRHIKLLIPFLISSVVSAILGSLVSALTDRNDFNYYIVTPLVIVVIAGVILSAYFLINLLVSFYKFLYNCWTTIEDDGYAMATPARAAGLLFLPVFNFYWIFIAYYGLSKQVNEYIDRHKLDKRQKSKKNQTLVFCILTVLIPIPVLGWILFTIISVVLYFMTITDFRDCCSYLAQNKSDKA